MRRPHSCPAEAPAPRSGTLAPLYAYAKVHADLEPIKSATSWPICGFQFLGEKTKLMVAMFLQNEYRIHFLGEEVAHAYNYKSSHAW